MMTEWIACITILAGIWIMIVIGGMLVSRAMLHQFAPNWSEAIGSLPVPRDVGKRSGWKSGHFRDRPGTWSVMPCVVSYSEQGVLVRDLWYQMFFWGLFSKHHTMFIPWTACSNPRQPWSHKWWSFYLFSNKSLVELDVAGQQFSIFVRPTEWAQRTSPKPEGEINRP